jgi:hypothetical protein
MLPPGAQYLRRCLIYFHSLDLQQDTSLLDSSVQAEPLWHNNRFTIAGLSAHRQKEMGGEIRDYQDPEPLRLGRHGAH